MKSVTPGQMDLFNAVAAVARKAAGAPKRAVAPLSCDLDLRRSLNDSIRNCTLSREQIAENMGAALGESITKAQLDSWTAESKGNTHRLPAAYLPAFCEATGDRKPLELLTTLLGGWLATEKDRLLAERGRLICEEEGLRKRKRLLQSLLDVTEAGQ